MPGDLARDAAELLPAGETSPGRPLHRLTELAAARFPGCAGATATLWEPDEVAATTATHPELASLAEQQFAAGDGPIIAALRTGGPSVTDDTLREERWPDWAAAALAAGVRSSVTIFHAYDSLSVTLSLYGVRTRAFDPQKLPLASLLAAVGTAAVATGEDAADMRRTTAQLEQAVQSRAVVDQARGVLMQGLGCDPDEAFEQLRHISQTEHVKLAEVARRVVDTHAREHPAGRR
jgi:ANTAR domain